MGVMAVTLDASDSHLHQWRSRAIAYAYRVEVSQMRLNVSHLDL